MTSSAHAPYTDLHAVRAGHERIDDRLCNWARWLREHRGMHRRTAPIWRQYRAPSTATVYGAEIRPPVRAIEALQTERAVVALPAKYRAAIKWCYVTKRAPAETARSLAVSVFGLMQLIHDGRQMLIDKGM